MSATRRHFLKIGLAGGAGIAGYNLLGTGWAQAAPGTLVLASFTQPLQVPPVLDMTAGGSYTLTATHVTRQLHPKLPAPTNVWSYVADSGAVDVNATPYRGFLGPTVVVQKGTPVTATYRNGIDVTNYAGAPWLPCDRNLTVDNDDKVRLLTHLHGGFVHGQMDGNPAIDTGYTKNETQTVWYGNEQRAAMIWYHDHGMGNTRLNVWAGLAGGYVIRDEFDTGEAGNPNHLPVGYGTGPGKYEVPLVFQDRAFVNQAGSGDMLYPTFVQDGVQGSSGLAGNAPSPYGNLNGPWTAEAFGDEGLVNGLVAPFLNVEPRLYRFRCLNGCNARVLDLQLVGGALGSTPPPPMYVIGNDGGLLPAPVRIKTLTMMPGERYDVLIDFTGYAGKVQLKNTNLNGFYTSPAPRLVDFLQFQVGGAVTSTVNNTVPTTLVGGQSANPGAPTPGLAPRTINMWEMNAGAMHWWMGLIGTGGGGADVDVPAGGFPDVVNGWNANAFHQKIGENPAHNSIQEWDFVNNTADSHPMHIHLVQFQVVHRRRIGAPVPANGSNVYAWEKGWKDTVSVHPGLITRVRTKFELPTNASPVPPPAGFVAEGTSPDYQLQPGEAERCFVYHCHILEHEENDMMRPFLVT
jgi:spore coat protein A